MLWGRGSSYMGHPFVLAPFVEETILFPMKLFWHICQNSAGHRSKGIFLVPWFCSLFYISVLMKIPHCLDYYSFVVSFEIEMHGSSNFVLHFQKKKMFGYSGLLAFVYRFENLLINLCKKSQVRLWKRLCWICRSIWYMALLTTLYLSSHEYMMSFPLFRSPSISFSNVL
jgi:hypothetical protein